MVVAAGAVSLELVAPVSSELVLVVVKVLDKVVVVAAAVVVAAVLVAGVVVAAVLVKATETAVEKVAAAEVVVVAMAAAVVLVMVVLMELPVERLVGVPGMVSTNNASNRMRSAVLDRPFRISPTHTIINQRFRDAKTIIIFRINEPVKTIL